MKKEVTRAIIILVLVLLSSQIIDLYITYGFLQGNQIDDKDNRYWEYENGVNVEVNPIVLEGTSGECWVLVHGYTATPDVFQELADEIHNTFNDSVYAPLLLGHGMVPSELLKYSMDDWYEQIENLALEKKCTHFVGSSMMSSLVLKYSEEYTTEKIVLLSMYTDVHMQTALDRFKFGIIPTLGKYKKKTTLGSIIDSQGLEDHISTWVAPLQPVVDYEKDFFPRVMDNLDEINGDVLFIHARNDTVVDMDSARMVFDSISVSKEFIIVDGEHVMLRDFDKGNVIQHIIDFRQKSS
tara:strand:+ start:2809 stop:3696 length:888 start_codon:yes stop_codon:yes gene_type:complete